MVLYVLVVYVPPNVPLIVLVKKYVTTTDVVVNAHALMEANVPVFGGKCPVNPTPDPTPTPTPDPTPTPPTPTPDPTPNRCPCSKENTCLHGTCVPCSDNKITIINSPNETLWNFSTSTAENGFTLWFYNEGGIDDTFLFFEDGRRWVFKNIKNNTFDLTGDYGIDGKKFLWKNFKLTTDNIYKTDDTYIDNVKQISNEIIYLHPNGC